VFSGPGVVALRNSLNAQAAGDASDGSSARRSSGSSSSSVAVPGPPVSSTAAQWRGVQDRRYPEAPASEGSSRDGPRYRGLRPNSTTRRDDEMHGLIRDLGGTSVSNGTNGRHHDSPSGSSHPPLSSARTEGPVPSLAATLHPQASSLPNAAVRRASRWRPDAGEFIPAPGSQDVQEPAAHGHEEPSSSRSRSRSLGSVG
jgi:hypothetical protein